MIRGMIQVGLANGKKPLPTTENTLRVLVVDDDRDATDSLGLFVEELGNQAHVTCHGMRLVSPRRPPWRTFESS